MAPHPDSARHRGGAALRARFSFPHPWARLQRICVRISADRALVPVPAHAATPWLPQVGHTLRSQGV